MTEERAAHLERIAHVETSGCSDEHAGIADLPARLGVERRAVEDHDGFLARRDGVELAAAAHDAEHLAAFAASAS